MIDTNILDLYSGNMKFIKNGACPTFIKRKENVDTFDNEVKYKIF